jgi:hypothetical protein
VTILGQHGRRAPGLAEGLSNLISRHRLSSFLATVAFLLLMADAIRRVLSDDAQVNVLTWTALALMAYAVCALIFVLHRAPQNVRFFMAWGMAVIPATSCMAAALTGSPTIMMWLGVLLSIGLVGWIAIRPA